MNGHRMLRSHSHCGRCSLYKEPWFYSHLLNTASIHRIRVKNGPNTWNQWTLPKWRGKAVARDGSKTARLTPSQPPHTQSPSINPSCHAITDMPSARQLCAQSLTKSRYLSDHFKLVYCVITLSSKVTKNWLLFRPGRWLGRNSQTPLQMEGAHDCTTGLQIHLSTLALYSVHCITVGRLTFRPADRHSVSGAPENLVCMCVFVFVILGDLCLYRTFASSGFF